MYKKDFEKWGIEKKLLDNKIYKIPVFHAQEIWWCSMGVNIGDEQDGKNDLFERPVLILRKFNNGLAWVVPISTKIKDGPYYFIITHDGIQFSVILSQLRLVSAKRFQRFVRKVSRGQFYQIQEKVKSLLN